MDLVQWREAILWRPEALLEALGLKPCLGSCCQVVVTEAASLNSGEANNGMFNLSWFSTEVQAPRGLLQPYGLKKKKKKRPPSDTERN